MTNALIVELRLDTYGSEGDGRNHRTKAVRIEVVFL